MEAKKKGSTISMRVDREFAQLCDEYKLKISKVTWNAIDYKRAQVSKIIARKFKEAGLHNVNI